MIFGKSGNVADVRLFSESFRQRWFMKMKIVLFNIIFLLFAAVNVFADDGFVNPVYTSDFVQQQQIKLSGVEQLFPRLIYWETFDGTTRPSVSRNKEDNYYYYSMKRAGKEEMMVMYPELALSSEGRGSSYFNTTGSYTDFYMHVEGQIIEEDYSKNAYLWFQYSNGTLVGEANRDSVSIEYPLRIEKYTSIAEERTYTTFYELREFENDYQVHTFDMIRLDGYTSVYIDNHFVVGFEDGLSGRFYMLFGVGLDAGGKYAAGQFDNFIVRVR